jgi:hypothetical protein
LIWVDFEEVQRLIEEKMVEPFWAFWGFLSLFGWSDAINESVIST